MCVIFMQILVLTLILATCRDYGYKRPSLSEVATLNPLLALRLRAFPNKEAAIVSRKETSG